MRRMKLRGILPAVLAVGMGMFGTITLAHGQEAPAKRVLGYLDPKTGGFSPVGTSAFAQPEATPATPTTGTMTLTITIKLATAAIAKSPIVCSGIMIGTSTNETTFAISEYLEYSNVAATVTSTTATCVVSIPYSWLLPAPSATVANTYELQFTVANAGSTATDLPAPYRASSQTVVSGAKVPATGLATAYTANVTL